MENSAIQWTDHTFNPWIGCTKISEGCAHCYAAMLMDTRYGKVKWGPRGKRQRTSEANWKLPHKWNRKAISPARVFCASLADVCDDHASIKSKWRWDLGALVNTTPNLIWMFLSKRPDRYLDLLIPYLSAASISRSWFGATVECQDSVYRIEALKGLRGYGARTLFVSAEPILGPVDIRPHLKRGGIDWVIAGGESGVGYRRLNLDWARSLRDQCQDAERAFFFKQHSGLHPKKLGRELDGREWNQLPLMKERKPYSYVRFSSCHKH